MSDDGDRTQSHRRLWTPWRMAYIGGARESGCVFCNRAMSNDDRASLILHRGERCFVIMNLYPYSTGHMMIVPYQHSADPEELPSATLHEMADLFPRCVSTIRETLNCAGFNAGMNLGEVAGAGVADHLHQHIVPRWIGDANFMPILASTTVMPELIPATYAKLRAEFERNRSSELRLVVLDSSAQRVLMEDSNGTARLPAAFLTPGASAWRTGTELLDARGVSASVIDWAGAASTRSEEPAALLLQSRSDSAGESMTWYEISELKTRPLNDVDRAIVNRLYDPALVGVK